MDSTIEERVKSIRALLVGLSNEEKSDVCDKACDFICSCKKEDQQLERGHNNCWNCEKPLSI